MYFNWEYNTRNTPYWKEIYEKNNITFNNYKPQFLNDEEEEKFYEEYGLEPDEQSNEIHEKSIIEIDSIIYMDDTITDISGCKMEPVKITDFFNKYL